MRSAAERSWPRSPTSTSRAMRAPPRLTCRSPTGGSRPTCLRSPLAARSPPGSMRSTATMVRCLALADPDAARELLHPGDPSRRTRLVVRGLEVRHISIVSLDAASEPATMTIDVELAGRRYLEDRDTAAVVSGSQSRQTTFTERWTLALNGPAEQPWRIAAVGTPAARRLDMESKQAIGSCEAGSPAGIAPARRKRGCGGGW